MAVAQTLTFNLIMRKKDVDFNKRKTYTQFFKLDKITKKKYPISPYVFVLCVEILSHVIREKRT